MCNEPNEAIMYILYTMPVEELDHVKWLLVRLYSTYLRFGLDLVEHEARHCAKWGKLSYVGEEELASRTS